MFARLGSPALAPWLSICLWAWKTAAYVNIPFSDTYYGVDGPWQAVTVQMGGWKDNIADAVQWTTMDLMPGGYFSSYVLYDGLCEDGASEDCGKGGTWNAKGGSAGYGEAPVQYMPVLDQSTTSGLYMTGPIYLQNLNVNQDDQYTVPNASVVVVPTGNQTLPSGNQIDLELGFFALGADDPQQEFTTLTNGTKDHTINAWIMPGYFWKKKITQSYSFSLHIGSTAFDYPGSMYFGGYDKGRAVGPGTTWGDTNPPLQDIVLGVETGGSPFKFTNKSSLLISNTSQHEPISVYPEPQVPQMYLPKQTCDNLANILPVYFDSSGYYLWDTKDPSYANITQSAAYLGFVFPPSAGGTENIMIKVPFALLVLNLTQEASGNPGNTPYFPCMPYDTTDGNYILGRAFLQAALFGKNFGNGIWYLAQAPGPGASSAGLGLEPHDIADSATNLEYYPDDGRFAASWENHWTPLETNADGSPVKADDSGESDGGHGGDDGGLSTGAYAGIGVGVAVLAIGLIAVLVWFLLRRRKTKKAPDSDSANEHSPMAAAHYSDNPNLHTPQPWRHPSDGQQPGSAHSPYSEHGQPHYAPQSGQYHQSAFRENYAPQKEGQGHELSELSGTMRAPAQELPGHFPQEMEAPYKQERTTTT